MVAAALCYAGLILTHNLSAYIYTGVLVMYCAFLLLRGIVEKQWGWLGALRPAGLLLGATLVAYALTAYLSMPAIFEKADIQLSGLLYVSHADHFPSLKDIMPNRIIHIYGIIFPESPEYAYKMGLVQVVLGGLGALAALAFFKRFPFRARGEAVISIIVFSVSFWFTRPDSLWAWDHIPLLPYAQFPWRFLLLMALPTSVATGFLVDVWPSESSGSCCPVLIVFTLLTNTLGLRPIMANTVEGDIDDADATRFELMYHLLGTTVAGEYIPRWVKDKPFISPEALGIVLGQDSPDVYVPSSDRGIEVHRTLKGTNEQRFDVNAPAAGRIVLNTAYFPGWRAEVNGRAGRVGITSPEGLIAVQVPAGQSTVRIVFENTAIRSQGETISLIALVICLALLAVAWARVPRSAVQPAAPPRLQTAGGPDRAAGRDPGADAVRGLVLRGGVPAAAAGPAPTQDQPRRYAMLLGLRPAGDGELLPHLQPVVPGHDAATLDLLAGASTATDAEKRAGRAVRAAGQHRRAELGIHGRGEPPALTPDGLTFRSDTRFRFRAACRRASTRSTSGSSWAGGPSECKNMELVELLPTQGSIRIGPVQVKSGATFANLRRSADQTFEQRGTPGVVRCSAWPERPSVVAASQSRLVADPPVANVPAGETLQLDLLWRSLLDHPGVYIVNTDAGRRAGLPMGLSQDRARRPDVPKLDVVRQRADPRPVSAWRFPPRCRRAVPPERQAAGPGPPVPIVDARGDPTGREATLIPS